MNENVTVEKKVLECVICKGHVRLENLGFISEDNITCDNKSCIEQIEKIEDKL